ncbi:MAG: phytoene desaturase family protein, partial [Candidatus Brocadiales bacterium]
MGRPAAKRYDVVVIGAGIGGLVCSAFLSRKGKKVLLVEQHFQPGGYCTTFKRKGFAFDAAVHHIGGCGRYSIVGRCLKELGLGLEFFRLDPMDSLIFPDFSVDIPSKIEDYISSLGKKHPLEKEHIERFFEDFVKLYRAIINEAADSPTLNSYKNTTYKEMLDNFFEDEELKRTLAGQWGYLGTPPEEISSIGMCQMLINYLRDGAYYPRGGTQNFANGLAKNFTESGGETLLSTMAEEILLEGRKAVGVRLEGRAEVLADVVVSNVDARQTFSRLVREEFNHAYSERLRSMKESPSYFLLYLGLDPEVSLKGFRRGFYHGPGNQWKYISAPTLVDNSLAPGGKQILNVVATVEENYEEVRDWKALKDRLTRENIDYLDGLISAPGGLKRHIEVVEAATPRTLERYTLNSRGAAYGWAVTPEQTGSGRLDHRTPVENLFLAGHWTNPGPGVCAVVSSGWR